MALRPNLSIRQEFRTAGLTAPEADNPAVLVGVHRQIEYQKKSGTFSGGITNGQYFFPGLITGSAVEDTSNADTYLRPRVYISNALGVAEVTSDVTFADLNNSGATPYFTISNSATAVFNVLTGTAGSYASTSGAAAGTFTDTSADFVEAQVAVGDTIKVGSRNALQVTSITSDTAIGVDRIDFGPTDSRLTITAKGSDNVRTLTYTGSTYSGFATNGVSRGDQIVLDGWSPRTTTGTLTYGATVAGLRSVTNSDASGFTGVNAGDVIYLRNTANEMEPAFIVTAVSGSTATVVNTLNSSIPESEVVDGTTAPGRYFEVRDLSALRTLNSSSGATLLGGGAYSAETIGVNRYFNDTTAAYVGVSAGDLIVVREAHTDTATITRSSSANTQYTRTTGSFVDDGFAVGQVITDGTTVAAVTVVTDTVLTIGTAHSADGSSVTVYSIQADIMFEVVSQDSTQLLQVKDVADSKRPASESGGYLRYEIWASAPITTSFSPKAAVSAATMSMRDIMWPVPFVSGATPTLPVAGDVVYSDDGILLFEVVSAGFITGDGAGNNVTVSGSTISGTGTVNFTTVFAVGDVIYLIDPASSTPLSLTNLLTITSVTATSISVTGTPITSAASNLTVQKFEVKDHSRAGFDVPDTDTIAGIGLQVRKADTASYSVLRVLDEKNVQVVHDVTGDEVTNQEVRGLISTVQLPNNISGLSYTVTKSLSNTSLTGDVLVSFSARRRDKLGQILEVDAATISDYGPVVPGNPLGFAASHAISNTAAKVKLVQVGDDTATGWDAAISTITTPDVYVIVPLTQDESILGKFRTHVQSESSPELKRERVLYQSHLNSRVTVRWKPTDVSVDVAKLKITSSAQTINITTTTDIVALGVVIGDYVEGTYKGFLASQAFVTGTYRARILTITDNGGSYDLTMVPMSGIGVTASEGLFLFDYRIESKPLDDTQLRDAIAAYPSTIKDRRIRNIYPDAELVSFSDVTNPNDTSKGTYGGGTVTDFQVGGWLMCARVGAMRSGLNPATPLAKRGVTGVQRLVTPFTTDVTAQDKILDGGNYLMTQPAGDNTAASAVRGVTTDVSTVFFLEEQVTMQVDNFARLLRRQLTPILGTTALDDSFFDLFSMTQAGVIDRVVVQDRSLKSVQLIEIKEDPNRADTFLASYNVGVFVSAANGDIVIYI